VNSKTMDQQRHLVEYKRSMRKSIVSMTIILLRIIQLAAKKSLLH